MLPRYAIDRKQGEPLSDSHATAVTIRDVIFEVLRETTFERRCAFTDLLDPAQTVPVESGDFSYVTYAWFEPFELLVMTLLYEFNGCAPPAEGARLPPTSLALTDPVFARCYAGDLSQCFVYIFHMSDNLWIHEEYGYSSGTSKTAFVANVCRGRHFMILGQEALAFSRLWCLFEASLSHPGRLVFSMLDGDIHRIVEAVRRVDAEAAAAPDQTVANDMRSEIVARFGSMESFNLLLRSKMLEVLTRSLQTFDRRLAEAPPTLPVTPLPHAGVGSAAIPRGGAGTLLPPLAASTSGLSSVSAAAVSVQWLLRFFEERVAPELGPLATTTDVVAHIIKPATQERRCRFFELGEAASLGSRDLWQGPAPTTQTADATSSAAHAAAPAGATAAAAAPLFFCSHAWARPFQRLVDSLVSFLDGADPEGTFVWIDVFAINQHDPLSDLRGGQTLRDTIELSVGTFMVLGEDAHPLTRLCAPALGAHL